MKRNAGWVSVLLIIIVFWGCQSNEEPPKREHLQVAVSITPLADFVKQVGGDLVNVSLIVPEGVNPHQFELSPQMLKQLSNTDLIVLNGLGLEFWSKAVYALDDKSILVTSDSIELPVYAQEELEGKDHHDYDHDHLLNPHIWLDPVRAIEQVRSIQNMLIHIDPEHDSTYTANGNEYIQSLQHLDDSLRNEIKSWRYKKFITFHPAWKYFADRYGLEQAAVIEPAHGIEAGPKAVAEIIRITQKIKAGAIFTEAMFPNNLSKTIADECGIHTVPLDPLGGSIGIHSYIELINYNVSQMAQIMK